MTIVITRPDFFTAEAERITELLLSGQASLVHIRKPGSTASETEALIRALPASLYDRLTLHDHFHLAVRYGLHGIHLNRRNPQAPAGWPGAVSISCHSIAELERCKHLPYAYMSLSPIFDSISKKGYKAAFSAAELEEARLRGIIDQRVMALGGVTFDKINEVKRMGFGGAMILGDAWK